jgi:hypothetical protein
MRCEHCRFFLPGHGLDCLDEHFHPTDGPPEYEPRETDHGACARIIHGNASGCYYSKVSNEPAIVTDGSGYAAQLRVLPSFGCVLFEVKP